MNSALGGSGHRQSRLRQYQDVDLVGRIEGSSPHALVALLYGELAVALDVMLAALDRGDMARQFQQHERASTILHRLEAGLDIARGGSLATSLAAIYGQMRRRLLDGRRGDRDAVAEVRDGVNALAEAWNQIPR